MAKVLISDDLSERAAEIFRERGVEVDVKVGMKPDQLIACIGEYDGLAIRSATKVTKAVLEAAKNLKVIGRAGIGVDNVDIPAATQRGVVVMNTPFGNTITTAEHAISLMLALARQIPAADASTKAGKWEKSRFLGVEITAKTLGLIGCGNIGSIVAERALGLKMKVIAHDPYLSAERAADIGIEKVDLDALFKRSDFITLHTPLTDQTRNIIDGKAIAKMKDGVRLINCARGGLIVEADLVEALKSGKVAGAALDVFAVEPARESPLFAFEQVVATPHLGASTTEAQENVALQVAEQMADYLVHGAVANALNTASVTAEEAPRLRPYMRLAEQLGGFAGQILETGINSVDVEYEGSATELNTRPLTAVVLQALLAPLLDSSVNMVNAPLVARERNIGVREIKHEHEGDYHTLMRLTVHTDGKPWTISGTLFADRNPRIVEINGINVEAEVGRNMLFATNDDKPGFIGALGTILGNAHINIATFHLGRAKSGDGALALLQVDDRPADAVIKKIQGLPDVRQVKMLSF